MGYFIYTKEELEILKKKDKKLAVIIEEIGDIKRPIISNLYHALIHAIIGQQISTKANQTIWQRMIDTYADFTPEQIFALSVEELQQIGITMKKATYIHEVSKAIMNRELDLEHLDTKSDEEICNELVKLKGIGVWTAEMIMLHSMQRKNILSYGDLAILRGLRMLYRHKEITPVRFARYKKRYEPYGSIASLYLWALSAGVLPEYTDPEKT